MTDDTEPCIRCGKPEADWNYWPHCKDCWPDAMDECHRALAEAGEMDEAGPPPGVLAFPRPTVEAATIAVSNCLDRYMGGFTPEARKQFAKLVFMIAQEVAGDHEETPA
jgi:hypothetical protein